MSTSIPPTPNPNPACPTWCTRGHDGEPPSEVCHTSWPSGVDLDTGESVSVQASQGATDVQALVFVTLGRQDVLHVRSAEARRIGRALIAFADAIDADVTEQLAREGIVVDDTEIGLVVRYLDTCRLTSAERARFTSALAPAWRHIVEEILSRREATS